MIQLQNISKWFGDYLLYEDLTLYIKEGTRIGLIAKNGTGKSTLLNIIAGTESSESGNISFRRDITVGYLSQDPDFDDNITVLEAVYNSNTALLKALSDYNSALESGDEKLLGDSVIAIDNLGGWDMENRAESILTKLNIHNLEQKMATLSGGERRRVALATVLVSEPDVLILDEPTNHLDLEMSTWLEEYLIKRGKTLFMVTHDRYFLDRVCSDIYELDQRTIYCYKGGYSDYLERRSERIVQFDSDREKAQNVYKKELEWMRRMPQARGTKSKYRQNAFTDVKERAFASRNDDSVNINIGHTRLGTKIFEAKLLNKSFGDKKVLTDFSYTFTKGEKLGIIGKNGTGKSTFLKILNSQIAPDSGMVDIGSTVQFGYYRQEGIDFDANSRVIDIARDIAEVVTLGSGHTIGISQFLTQFLFEPETQYSLVSKLSGGERRRLYLLTILMRSPNFLILDEPTNDLDIATLNVLENYLESYTGCVIVVSHDRYFMDRVTDHLLIFGEGGTTSLFEGNYTQYRNNEEEKAELLSNKGGSNNKSTTPVPAPAPSAEKQKSSDKAKKKLSYKDSRELELLEVDIANLEKEKLEIENKLSSGNIGADEISLLSIRHAEVSDLLDEKSMRWMELEELKG